MRRCLIPFWNSKKYARRRVRTFIYPIAILKLVLKFILYHIEDTVFLCIIFLNKDRAKEVNARECKKHTLRDEARVEEELQCRSVAVVHRKLVSSGKVLARVADEFPQLRTEVSAHLRATSGRFFSITIFYFIFHIVLFHPKNRLSRRGWYRGAFDSFSTHSSSYWEKSLIVSCGKTFFTQVKKYNITDINIWMMYVPWYYHR